MAQSQHTSTEYYTLKADLSTWKESVDGAVEEVKNWLGGLDLGPAHTEELAGYLAEAIRSQGMATTDHGIWTGVAETRRGVCRDYEDDWNSWRWGYGKPEDEPVPTQGYIKPLGKEA